MPIVEQDLERELRLEAEVSRDLLQLQAEAQEQNSMDQNDASSVSMDVNEVPSVSIAVTNPVKSMWMSLMPC